MKPWIILTTMSLLSILFVTIHLTSDTLHARIGTPEAGGSTLVSVPILIAWMYGTLLLSDKRSGWVIMLIGSLVALAMPYFHLVGPEGIFRGAIAAGSDPFVFVWILHAVAVTGLFSLLLSVRCLLNPRWARSPLFADSSKG